MLVDLEQPSYIQVDQLQLNPNQPVEPQPDVIQPRKKNKKKAKNNQTNQLVIQNNSLLNPQVPMIPKQFSVSGFLSEIKCEQYIELFKEQEITDLDDIIAMTK